MIPSQNKRNITSFLLLRKRLSDLLRARGISKLFLQLASLAMPVEPAPRLGIMWRAVRIVKLYLTAATSVNYRQYRISMNFTFAHYPYLSIGDHWGLSILSLLLEYVIFLCLWDGYDVFILISHHQMSSPRSLVDCDGRLQPVELNALAVRREVNPQLAAIALAASQRTYMIMTHDL